MGLRPLVCKRPAISFFARVNFYAGLIHSEMDSLTAAMDYDDSPAIVLDGVRVPVLKVFSTPVDVNMERQFIAFCGAQEVAWRKIAASSVADSQLSWNINTPSIHTGIGRNMFIEYELVINLRHHTIDPAPDPPLTAAQKGALGLEILGKLGIRNLPLHSASDTASLDLNSTRFSWNPRSTVSALSACKGSDVYYTSGGGISDTLSFYGGVTGTPLLPLSGPRSFPTNAYQTAVNNSPSVTGEESRNVVHFLKDGQGPVTVRDPFSVERATVAWAGLTERADGYGCYMTLHIYEPVIMPPLSSGPEELPALVGIQNLSLTYILANNLRRMLVMDRSRGSPTTSLVPVSASFTPGSVFLHMCHYKLNPTYEVPSVPIYSCSDISTFKTDLGNAFVYGVAQANQQCSTIGLNQVPKMIYVFAKRRQTASGDQEVGCSDTWLRITQATINFNNKAGLLSGATEHDLYRLSCKNGLKLTWAQVKYLGMPLVINPAEDLSLGLDQSAGTRGSFNFDVTVTLTTPITFPAYQAAADALVDISVDNLYSLVVVVVNDGVLWVGLDGILKSQFGPLTQHMVLEAPIQFGGHAEYSQQMLYGGGFFSRVKSLINKVAKGFQTAAPHLSRVLEAVEPIAQHVPGRKGEILRKGMTQAQRVAASKLAHDVAKAAQGATGGVLIGGKQYVSKSELQSRFKHF